jgi:hypothetical protein
LSHRQIAQHLHISVSAVRYAVAQPDVAPQHKNASRPATITPAEEVAMIEWVTQSDAHRVNSCEEISEEFFEGRVGPDAVKNTLYRHGYHRWMPVADGPELRGEDRRRHNSGAKDSGGGSPRQIAAFISSATTSALSQLGDDVDGFEIDAGSNHVAGDS